VEWEETRVNNDGSQAVRMLPLLPMASMVANAERRVGRKEAAQWTSTEHSFVSWIHNIEGEAVEIASRTMGLFFRQPSPCMFQDSILTSRKALIITLIRTKRVIGITAIDTRAKTYCGTKNTQV
jgi:hypothetical protein